MLHVSGIQLDLSWFLQLVFTLVAIAFGILHLVKKTASKYFVVDATFDEGGGTDSGRACSSTSSQMIAVDEGHVRCAVCTTPATKHCAGCKIVRYCSAVCQRKHWGTDHKFKCNKLKLNATRNANNSRTKLQQLKKVLFPYEEFVKLFNWENPGFPPCGLLNCGNSCFANAVLQCLSCTRPLIAYLLERDHRRECKRNDWCFLCELQSHVERARLLRPFSPINILSRLPNIGGNLGYGKQEDAHEFMRFAIDTMQSVCLDEFGGEKALHPWSQETTLIQYTFGGYLQSQVTCTKCKKISDRYENMMDLTVEIHGDAASLEECLDQFTAKEWLDGENMYKCDGCNDYVKACKHLTIHKAPNILTIALKRFQSGRYGKLNKRVTFPETLDLSPYMSKPGDGTDMYQLYAVVVHIDMLNASFFGHYICYMKDFHGNWYRVDDCKVVTVELEEVLAQGAYMLLYSRMSVRPPCVNPLEITAKENDPVEVIKEAQPSSQQPVESVAIEGPINSFTGESVTSELGSLNEESVSKEDAVFMDLDDPPKVNLIFTSDTDLDSGRHDPVIGNSRSQDASDMDLDDHIEVNLMSAGGDQGDLVLGNNLNPSLFVSKGFDDDEKDNFHATKTAFTAGNFRCGVLDSVPLSRVPPSTKTHNLDFDASGVDSNGLCGFDNLSGVGDIHNEELMSSKVLMDACLSSQSDIQEIAHSSVPSTSVTEILHETNTSKFESQPKPMVEQAIVERSKTLPAAKVMEGKASKLAKDNSNSVKLKPLLPSGFLDKRTKCRSPNRNMEASERFVEVGLSQVGKTCNGFKKPGLLDENISNANVYNGRFDSDAPPNSGFIDQQSESCSNGSRIAFTELAECFGGSSHIAAMASSTKLSEQVPTSDVECPAVSGNETSRDSEEVMPPVRNGTFPNENGFGLDRSSSTDDVSAASSDIIMLDQSDHACPESLPQPELDQVASVGSGNGQPASHVSVKSSEAAGNSSCSKTKLNPLISPGFLGKRAELKSQDRNGDAHTEPIRVCKVNNSNGFAVSGDLHKSSSHVYDHDEITKHNKHGNGRSSHCNGNGNLVNVDGSKSSQKGTFARGFLDKAVQKKLLIKDGGIRNVNGINKAGNGNLAQGIVWGNQKKLVKTDVESQDVNEIVSSENDRKKLPRVG